MDIEQEERLITRMSLSTLTPIKYVPLLLLYYNGIPIKEFIPDEVNVNSNVEKLNNFLMQESDNMKTLLLGGASNTTTPAQNNPVPYSAGIPGNRKRVCYLPYETAYPSR
jgi:hypothetical protein